MPARMPAVHSSYNKLMAGRNRRKAQKGENTLLWIVLAAVVVLMILLFVGNYMYAPKEPLRP
jgi:hypothetical protein